MKTGVVILLALALAGCGAEPERSRPGTLFLAPGDPDEALRWVEEAQDDPAELRKRLDVWPLSDAFLDEGASQVALTWRLQLALRDSDVERADALHELLADHFDGAGQYPEGRELSALAVRLAVFEEALLAARRRIEGLQPDQKRARSALDVAERMLVDGEVEDRTRLAGTRAWIERTQATNLVKIVGAEVTIRDGVQATLVVIADDFTLGDGVFSELLKQWREAHAEARFDRVLIPLLRGQVRMGLRLVPAESPEEELASIAGRCVDASLECLKALPVERLARIGLREGDAAILLADGRGRIVARLSGRNPDLRPLEPALQRLLSR